MRTAIRQATAPRTRATRFRGRGLLALSSLLVLAGCGSAPEAEHERARSALEGARKAQAEIYAATAYRSAVDTLAAAEREQGAQQQKFVLARKFGHVKTLYLGAERLGDDAREAAERGMEEAREEAESLLSELQTKVARLHELSHGERGQQMLQAPRSRAAMEALQHESGQIESSLLTLGSALQRKAYGDALQVGRSARDQAESILADLEQAIATGVVPQRGNK